MKKAKPRRVFHRCRDCSAPPWTKEHGLEDYMVRDDVWATAGMPASKPPYREGGSGFLCIGCLEARLGRTLKASDFTAAPVNDHDGVNGPRLARRRRAQRSRKLAPPARARRKGAR